MYVAILCNVCGMHILNVWLIITMNDHLLSTLAIYIRLHGRYTNNKILMLGVTRTAVTRLYMQPGLTRKHKQTSTTGYFYSPLSLLI